MYGSIEDSSFAQSVFSGAHAEDMRIVKTNLQDSHFAARDEFAPIQARGMSVRDSNLSSCNFESAYLYRSFFTGDHVENMNLSHSNFKGALMIQSYVAAMADHANFEGANLTYARLNQSNFSESNFDNASLYKAVLTKTVFDGSTLKNVKPPFFVDRTHGILEAHGLDPVTKRWIVSFNELMAMGDGFSST